jgi:enterochelin esterase-like enzyme
MTISILVASLLFLGVVSGADFSGKYKGALESSNGGRMNVLATIRQEGDKVTGTIGPSATQQAPLEDVTLKNGILGFRIAPLTGLRFTFAEAGDTLSGTLSTLDGTQPRFDRVALQRIGPITLADTMPPVANEGPFRSIRILKLREELERNPDALNEFWTSVKRSGAPLVEPDPGDERFQYATFLWQGLPEHKNVIIMWMPFSAARPADFLMVNLPNTDLWFRTIRLPRGARLQYRLSANDPLAAMPPTDGRRNAVKDPLNPRDGLLELPGAIQQPYYSRRDGAATMTRYEHTLSSRQLKQERRIVVYTPPNYDPKGKPYASIYMFDGEDRDGLVFATWTFENMIADKKIPPMVVVRIVNPNPASRLQLSGHDPFFDFLVKEAVPYVSANYNVSRRPAETAISGYSLGGLASAYAGLRHSEVFGLILAQSGSYWYEPSGDETAEPNWIAAKFIASPKLPLRFYMDAGLFDTDLSGRGTGILLPNRHFRDVLRAKGYEVTYQEFPGGHDYINWRGTLADGLATLFGPAPKRE